MTSAGDIINWNAGLWVSQDYVLRTTEVSGGYLGVAGTRARRAASPARSWHHETVGGRRYFMYSSLPARYSAQLPDYADLARQAVRLQGDAEAIVSEAVAGGYKLHLDAFREGNDDARMKRMATSAAILCGMKAYIDTRGLSYKKSDFFRKMANELSINHVKYLPKTWRGLRDKVEAYAAGAALNEVVRTKNLGNRNAARFKNNPLIVGWVCDLAGSQKNYSGAQIYRNLVRQCQASGLSKIPSMRWINYFLSSPKTKNLIKDRYGAGSRHNCNYRGNTPMQKAPNAGDCWEIDGTRVNIIDHAAVETDAGGKRRHVHKYLYIVVVRDVMSGLPVGWEYCHVESSSAVISALAMAVRNTGYLPCELVHDRFPGHNTDEWQWVECELRRRGIIMTVAHKAEGKAGVERWFGTLQDVFMSENEKYYGQGVKSTRRHAHRTPEYIAEMQRKATKNGFDFDAACRETDAILHNHNNRPYSAYSKKFKHISESPQQLHDMSERPNAFDVADHEYCYLFGLKRGISIRNYMITAEIDRQTHYYGIDDCDVTALYTGVKLLCCFDREDRSRVHVYNGENYVGTFNEITPAQRYGPDRDMRAVGKIRKIVADNEAYRARELAEIAARKRQAEASLPPPPSPSPNGACPGVQSGSEAALLMGALIGKHEHEAAETAFLNETLPAASPQNSGDSDEEEDLFINVNRQY
ncbi:MAG: hypothetical protein LBR08_10415 [Bacteroidales bacterium]|jgi:transposase InsO family protein|nr:hypothetical protein [Bacteroidales bacterium]